MTRLRVALSVSALMWLALLSVGFVAPGGWQWGMAGPVGHIENFMISLWAVTLVIMPLLALRDSSRRDGLIQAYLLGVLAVVLSTVRAESLEWFSDGPPLAAAALSLVLMFWAHVAPARFFR